MHFCDRHVRSIQYAATRRLQLRAWPILCTGLRPVQLFLVHISFTFFATQLLMYYDIAAYSVSFAEQRLYYATATYSVNTIVLEARACTVFFSVTSKLLFKVH